MSSPANWKIIKVFNCIMNYHSNEYFQDKAIPAIRHNILGKKKRGDREARTLDLLLMRQTL